jgi:hypothetical protein
MYEDMNIKACISMGLNRDYVPYFHCDTIKSVTTADKQSISVTDIVYTIDDVQDSVQDIFDKIYEED